MVKIKISKDIWKRTILFVVMLRNNKIVKEI